MFKMKSLLIATTLGALAAAPAFALEVGPDAMLGAAPEDMSGMTMMEDSAFMGNEVRTKDQIVIGQVESVMMDANGATVALITINNDIASKSSVKSFTVPLATDSTADGSLTLAWTEADLFKALDSNLQPTGN